MGLPPIEVSISLCLYIGALIYAIYHAFQYGQSIDIPENEDSFSTGWSWIGRKRDYYDFEWEPFVENTRKYVYWYTCHVLLSEIVRQLEPHRVCFIHTAIGISFVWTNFKPLVAGAMFAMIFSYYVAMAMRKRYVWILTVVWLAILNTLKQSDWEKLLLRKARLDEKEIYDAMMALSWLLLRVTSFSIDYCNARSVDNSEQTRIKFSTHHYLSYSFYLPIYLHGPPIIYERYAKMIPRNQLYRVEESMYRLKELLISLVRIACVYVVNEICMHFIYANVVILHSDQMEHMNLWAVYGFAYAIGQYFCNKYIVAYGLGLSLAKFDRIDTPRKPMCVGRIHLYSKMWKHFDQGLYDFLFKHIYAEMCTKTSSLPRKLFASFVSFAFVYLWHGTQLFLLIWVFLNLASLYVELFGRHISRSEQYNQLLKPIGSKNIQRLNAVLGGQLLICSSISNVMFIGGLDIGKWLMIHTYFTGGFVNYLVLSITAYNLYQVSTYIFKCEEEEDKKTA